MSSREFLALLDGLPDKSRYKGALRGRPHGLPHDWSPDEYRQARIAKQLIAMSPTETNPAIGPYYAALFSPVERAAMEAQQQAKDAQRRTTQKRFHKGLYARVPGKAVS